MGEEDRWAMSHAEEDGQPVLLRFRSDLPVKETARFPFLISILWIYDGSKNGGMPDDRTLAMMDRVEDSLDWIDESGEAFLMVAVTGNNRREWIWYTNNRDRYMALVNRSLPRQTKFPIDFTTSEDPSWLTYKSIRSASTP
ncbi:MAG: hypothetical protein DMF59_19620 [Acidobacteria bacterium]|nr:MAG: hypothetical protein DMF59_19620 [Acidobacteriota bacterium]